MAPTLPPPAAVDYCYTLIDTADETEQPTVQELKQVLETGETEVKINAMRRILLLMLNGDPLNALLMHVIRFVMPSRNKALKRLLLVYWEICPKYNADGKLKQEMILVINALRNDAQHPNEYVRGMTLRFLCKLREPELLEPLLPAVRGCLEHRHAYVRKNAVLAIHAIFRNFEHLIPDGPEVIAAYLTGETDAACRRHAFTMLLQTKTALAAAFFAPLAGQLASFDEPLQLAVLELVRKDAGGDAAARAQYLQSTVQLLQAASPAVKYEAATTLVAMTSHASATKAAAQCYIDLVLKVSDNNSKLIVLDRLQELAERHARVVDDLVMDVLRVLASADMEVRRRCLRIAMDLVTGKNVDEVVQFLKKEIVKTHDAAAEADKSTEYRQLLVQSVHQCALQFPEVAQAAVHVLMSFLGDAVNTAAVDVVYFVRSVMEKFPQLRESLLEQLLEGMLDIRTGRVFRTALWIVGEYAQTAPAIERVMQKLRAAVGELPIVASERRHALEAQAEAGGGDDDGGSPRAHARPRVLADGTYASESAVSSAGPAGRLHKAGSGSRLDANSERPPLRALLLNGDFYVATVLCATLTKLALRYATLAENPAKVHALRGEVMLVMTSIVRLGRSELPAHPMDEDALERILTCLRVVADLESDHSADADWARIRDILLEKGRAAYAAALRAEEAAKRHEKARAARSRAPAALQVDDAFECSFLTPARAHAAGGSQTQLAQWDDADVTRAAGAADDAAAAGSLKSKLSRVLQLTGFSDPVYAEAYVTVLKFDILLDVLIVNQTSNTLQNLTLELATLGDLKLVDRPAPVTIEPQGFHSVKATVKVASTETGVIFGNIVYDGASAVDARVVILYDIHVDIMDYIKPAHCTDISFRSMWTEFEWENKVNVHVKMRSLAEFRDLLERATNMQCLAPRSHAEDADGDFMAANFYARTLFGEDALANMCLELQGDTVVGHIRIRSRTQGIALSLGDKITLAQRNYALGASS